LVLDVIQKREYLVRCLVALRGSHEIKRERCLETTERRRRHERLRGIPPLGKKGLVSANGEHGVIGGELSRPFKFREFIKKKGLRISSMILRGRIAPYALT